MDVIWAQKWKGRARKTRERSGRVSPLRLVFFLGPIFHAIQSNNLVIVDHFKVYAFPVLKAIKYSCNINFTFSALKVAIVKLRSQFGNQHISLLASSLFMVRIRATERRRFAGWKWKFQWEIVASTLFLSPPLVLYPGCHRLFERSFRFPSSLSSGFGLPPRMCRPSANTENPRRTREKNLVPRVLVLASPFACWSRVTSRDSPK